MTVDANGLRVNPPIRSSLGREVGAAGPTSRRSRHDGHWFSGKLLPFQRTAVNFLLAHPNAVYADDVGLGKTVATLSYVARLEEAGMLTRRHGSVCRVLWLTSPGLVDQTRDEIEQFLPGHSVVTQHDRMYRRESIKAQQQWTRRFGSLGPDILVLGYKQAMSSAAGLTATNMAPGLVVLDDANRVGGVSGKQYNAVCRITERAPRVVSITANPLWNDPMDMFRLLRATNVPGLWAQGVFERQFVSWRHPNVHGPGRAQKDPDAWKSPERIPEVREFLATCMIQRSAAEVKAGTPTRTGDLVRLVPLTPSQMQAYDAASRQEGREAVVKMGAAGRLAGYESPIVDALMEELDARAGRQVVVFSEDPAVLGLVDEELTSRGASFVRVDGDMKQDDRNVALENFRQRKVRILLGSEVITRGVQLGNCNELLTLDPTYVAAEEYQREGRLRGLLSQHATYRHLALVPDHPLNRSKLHQLDRKWETANAVHLGRPPTAPAWASVYADRPDSRRQEPTGER